MESELSSTYINNIVSDYGPLVSSICHRMIQNEDDSKDAAQEAWVEIFKGLPEFRGDAKLSTWIYTVAYHAVMRFTQKERKYSTKFLQDYFHGEQLEVPYYVDYDKEIWTKEMCDKCLTGVLHCLDAESRLVYLFRDMMQLSYEDIGLVMEKDPLLIRKIVSRSRRKLRSFLNEECILYNPCGKCKCRMKNLVTEVKLPQEYLKLRNFIGRVNLYLESQKILPQKDYWKEYMK